MKRLTPVLIVLGFVALVQAWGWVLPNGTRVRAGTTNTSITVGVVTNDELAWLPAVGELHIGVSGGVTKIIGKTGVATTADVNNAVGTFTANIVFLDASTNASTLYVTNGTVRGVSTP